MVVKLQDFKLDEQESRLVLFGSTVFKVKCRVSLELRAAVRSNEVRERAIQQDLKRATAAILSQVFKHSTLPILRTDTIAVYTDSCQWTACDKLYFAHHGKPLRAHPEVILMLVSLPPLATPLNPPPSLGKHSRGVSVSERDDGSQSDHCAESSTKKMKFESDRAPEGGAASVPDPGEACLPGREGRVAPEREVVMAASEQTKRRLGLLSQPHWTVGSVLEEEEIAEVELKNEDATNQQPSKGGISLFQYLKSLFSWS